MKHKYIGRFNLKNVALLCKEAQPFEYIKGFFFSVMIFCVKENVIFKLKITLKGKDNCKVFL